MNNVNKESNVVRHETSGGARAGWQSVDVLAADFRGVFNLQTVERLYGDSYESLSGARIAAFTSVLAERMTRDRLRALAKTEGLIVPTIPSVLFLCVHNAGRSQMAAGWLRELADGAALAYSGGSMPAAEVNAVAIEAMHEVGIDITQEFPKPWTDEIVRAADVVVTMGCGDACPVYPGVRYVDWELEDPAGQPIEVVRRVRDAIRDRVAGLLSELGVEVAPLVRGDKGVV